MEGFATLRFEHGDEFGQAHLFMRGDCSGKVQNTPSARHVITKTMNAKKWRITESAVTPSHGGFRSSEVNTVAISAKRIFLCEWG